MMGMSRSLFCGSSFMALLLLWLMMTVFGCKFKYLADASADGDEVTSNRRLRRSATHNKRRLVTKDENIVDVLDHIGTHVEPLSFAIEAEYEDDNAAAVDSTLLYLDKVSSAVTLNTVFNFPDRSFDYDKVDVSKITFLASNPSTSRDLTVVSVNTNSGHVNGLHQLGGSGVIRNISNKNNSNSPTLKLRSTSSSSEPRKLDCAVDHDHDHHVRGWDHEHEGHNHGDGDQHTRHMIDASNLRRKVTGSTSNGFQIDLIVDIDSEMVDRNKGLDKAIEYVNFIITTTNTILEDEFDLRLNVVKISETTMFNQMGFGTIRDAVQKYRETYRDTIGSEKRAHLRHALVGRDLGGGIAFTDSVCDPTWGFGISSGIRGNINNMDLYDVYMFAHEIGHNFGSGHPFDKDYFSPPVDTCQQGSCPEALPLDHSSTLMSYCGYFCGDVSNTAFTYGGKWDGVLPREDLESWMQNPALVKSSVSKNPQRISHLIWYRLSQKEECIGKRDPLNVTLLSVNVDPTESQSPSQGPSVNVDPTESQIPSQGPSVNVDPTESQIPSQGPSESHAPSGSAAPTSVHNDGGNIRSKPSSSPTASASPSVAPSSHPTRRPSAPPSAPPRNTPTTAPSYPPTLSLTTFPPTVSLTTFPPTVSPTKVPSNSPTNGMYSISPLKQCESNCVKTNDYMFNVRLGNNAANNIEIYSVSFRHKAPSDHRNVVVYIIENGYEGKEESMEGWIEIASDRVPKQNNVVSTIKFASPRKLKAGEKVGFRLITEESILLAGKFGNTETMDDRKVALQYGTAVINDQFTESYSWTGSIDYFTE